MKNKKDGKFSKLIVSLVISLNVLFAVWVLVIFEKTASEPSGLIVAWFSFTTVELWSLSRIKIKGENKDD